MLRPVIKSCFFYSPAPGYLCQSERFSCLRFLSQGDYLCGAGEGFSELQGVGAGSALVCYLTPAVLRKAGSLFFFFISGKKKTKLVFGNEIPRCGVKVMDTGASAWFFREAEAVDREVIRGTIYCNTKVPKHVASQGALPAPAQQKASCRSKKCAVTSLAQDFLAFVLRLRFPHIKSVPLKRM